jgi:cytoskeletal protein RodZ
MDLYTKIVLTVIAGALSVLAWQNLAGAPAHAQTPTLTHVAICDTSNPNRCVGINEKGWLDVLVHQ